MFQTGFESKTHTHSIRLFFVPSVVDCAEPFVDCVCVCVWWKICQVNMKEHFVQLHILTASVHMEFSLSRTYFISYQLTKMNLKKNECFSIHSFIIDIMYIHLRVEWNIIIYHSFGQLKLAGILFSLRFHCEM